MQAQKFASRLYSICFFASAIVLIVAAVLFRGEILGQQAHASAMPPQGNASQAPDTPTDDLQRSIRIDKYSIVSDSGSGRGETIYFYKCWMCHNKYTKSAPYLQDLYKRSNLVSGQPVNDETVTAQIKNGSADMPSFRTSLSDADVADLLAYLREGKCCLEGEDPPKNPWYRASTNKWTVQSGLSGGPTGVVRVESGDSPLGIMVQLIAPNGVRTTVYADEKGHYEFPRIQAGAYTLRIAKPLQYKPYRRDSVEVNGANQLDDIVLERVSKSELLPASSEVESQLGGAELLWNLPGNPEEKLAIANGCGCHSYQQILRNRYDERSWHLILDRMMGYAAAPIINRDDQRLQRAKPEEDMLVNWLTRVRGPDSKDPPVQIFPRQGGAAIRAIITEYELPRVLLSTHDVAEDSKGNIWFTSHKTRYFGKLDPRTGIVTEYALPLVPGVMPGTHHIAIDKNDIVWLSENWAKRLVRFDPQTEQVTSVQIASKSPINSAGFGNFALAPDGFVWYTEDGAADKIDPKTGQVVQRYPMKSHETYENAISADGRFWAGGSPAAGGNAAELLDIESGKMLEVNSGARMSYPARGGFDPFDNAWFGGRGGAFIEVDAKAGLLREFWPPTPYWPYTKFYEAMPDKNGEVWAGVNYGQSFLRFNPKTSKWTEYVMPEPFSFDRRTLIDNSTNPVTVWYVDYQGYIVRIQPLE